jgi:acyl-homoserine lactone acylase PvdQ
VRLLFFLIAWTSVVWAQPDESVDEGVTNGLDSLLVAPNVDSVIAGLGDSLFVPPAERARIIRDRYGVPHIYGHTDVDVAFGFGYAQAQDHLIPMLLSYRQAKGEAAEIVGPSAIESDFKSHTWRINHVAGELYGTIPEDTRDLIGGFVDGVNHYIDLNRQVLPSWVEPIRGTDIVAATRWMVLQFVERQGQPELSSKGLLAGAPLGILGSNQVVVSPTRSHSGRTLMMSDLHFPWDTPYRMCEAHLVSDEGLNVYGGTFFGWPVLFQGHNGKITWSFTANEADVFDLYEIKLDQANPRRYLYEREKERISSRRVRVRVQRGAGMEEVSRDLLSTHHGPIYKIGENWAYAAKAPMDEIANVVGQLYEMSRAQDLRQFRSAVSRLQIPAINVMYGDLDGSTYYVFAARSPLRSDKFDWRAPVPGWTKESEWRGLLPFSQLPQVVNPVPGFMQNCNVPPDALTSHPLLDRSNYPASLGWGRMTDRGRRTRTWLASQDVVSVDELVTFSRDSYLIVAEELKGLILGGYNRIWQELYDPDARVAEAVNLLRSWDNRADVDSRVVLLFSTWRGRFVPLVDQLPRDQRKDITVLERVAVDALQQSIAYLLETYGRLDVRWGEVHVIERGDMAYPVGGPPDGIDAVHATWSMAGDDGVFRVSGGSAFSMVVALGEQPEAWTLVPFGSSEDPNSPHFSDQAERQTDGRLKRAWFTSDEVTYNAESVLTVPFEKEAIERERMRIWWKSRAARAPAVSDTTAVEETGD